MKKIFNKIKNAITTPRFKPDPRYPTSEDFENALKQALRDAPTKELYDVAMESLKQIQKNDRITKDKLPNSGDISKQDNKTK
jgi:hypothetical protein